MPVRLVEA